MRRFVFIIALFLTLTPTLACAMTSCPSMEPSNEQTPCHDSDADIDIDIYSSTMLMLDCMGLDLFHNDINYDDALGTSIDSDDIVWDVTQSVYNDTVVSANTIRGPPLSGLRLHDNIPTYLYTQRLRL